MGIESSVLEQETLFDRMKDTYDKVILESHEKETQLKASALDVTKRGKEEVTETTVISRERSDTVYYDSNDNLLSPNVPQDLKLEIMSPEPETSLWSSSSLSPETFHSDNFLRSENISSSVQSGIQMDDEHTSESKQNIPETIIPLQVEISKIELINDESIKKIGSSESEEFIDVSVHTLTTDEIDDFSDAEMDQHIEDLNNIMILEGSNEIGSLEKVAVLGLNSFQSSQSSPIIETPLETLTDAIHITQNQSKVKDEIKTSEIKIEDSIISVDEEFTDVDSYMASEISISEETENDKNVLINDIEIIEQENIINSKISIEEKEILSSIKKLDTVEQDKNVSKDELSKADETLIVSTENLKLQQFEVDKISSTVPLTPLSVDISADEFTDVDSFMASEISVSESSDQIDNLIVDKINLSAEENFLYKDDLEKDAVVVQHKMEFKNVESIFVSEIQHTAFVENITEELKADTHKINIEDTTVLETNINKDNISHEISESFEPSVIKSDTVEFAKEIIEERVSNIIDKANFTNQKIILSSENDNKVSVIKESSNNEETKSDDEDEFTDANLIVTDETDEFKDIEGALTDEEFDDQFPFDYIHSELALKHKIEEQYLAKNDNYNVNLKRLSVTDSEACFAEECEVVTDPEEVLVFHLKNTLDEPKRASVFHVVDIQEVDSKMQQSLMTKSSNEITKSSLNKADTIADFSELSEISDFPSDSIDLRNVATASELYASQFSPHSGTFSKDFPNLMTDVSNEEFEEWEDVKTDYSVDVFENDHRLSTELDFSHHEVKKLEILAENTKSVPDHKISAILEKDTKESDSSHECSVEASKSLTSIEQDTKSDVLSTEKDEVVSSSFYSDVGSFSEILTSSIRATANFALEKLENLSTSITELTYESLQTESADEFSLPQISETNDNILRTDSSEFIPSYHFIKEDSMDNQQSQLEKTLESVAQEECVVSSGLSEIKTSFDLVNVSSKNEATIFPQISKEEEVDNILEISGKLNDSASKDEIILSLPTNTGYEKYEELISNQLLSVEDTKSSTAEDFTDVSSSIIKNYESEKWSDAEENDLLDDLEIDKVSEIIDSNYIIDSKTPEVPSFSECADTQLKISNEKHDKLKSQEKTSFTEIESSIHKEEPILSPETCVHESVILTTDEEHKFTVQSDRPFDSGKHLTTKDDELSPLISSAPLTTDATLNEEFQVGIQETSKFFKEDSIDKNIPLTVFDEQEKSDTSVSRQQIQKSIDLLDSKTEEIHCISMHMEQKSDELTEKLHINTVKDEKTSYSSIGIDSKESENLLSNQCLVSDVDDSKSLVTEDFTDVSSSIIKTHESEKWSDAEENDLLDDLEIDKVSEIIDSDHIMVSDSKKQEHEKPLNVGTKSEVLYEDSFKLENKEKAMETENISHHTEVSELTLLEGSLLAENNVQNTGIKEITTLNEPVPTVTSKIQKQLVNKDEMPLSTCPVSESSIDEKRDKVIEEFKIDQKESEKFFEPTLSPKDTKDVVKNTSDFHLSRTESSIDDINVKETTSVTGIVPKTLDDIKISSIIESSSYEKLDVDNKFNLQHDSTSIISQESEEILTPIATPTEELFHLKLYSTSPESGIEIQEEEIPKTEPKFIELCESEKLETHSYYLKNRLAVFERPLTSESSQMEYDLDSDFTHEEIIEEISHESTTEDYFESRDRRTSENDLESSLYESWSERSFELDEHIDYGHDLDDDVIGDQLVYDMNAIQDDEEEAILRAVDENLRKFDDHIIMAEDFRMSPDEEFDFEFDKTDVDIPPLESEAFEDDAEFNIHNQNVDNFGQYEREESSGKMDSFVSISSDSTNSKDLFSFEDEQKYYGAELDKYQVLQDIEEEEAQVTFDWKMNEKQNTFPSDVIEKDIFIARPIQVVEDVFTEQSSKVKTVIEEKKSDNTETKHITYKKQENKEPVSVIETDIVDLKVLSSNEKEVIPKVESDLVKDIDYIQSQHSLESQKSLDIYSKAESKCTVSNSNVSDEVTLNKKTQSLKDNSSVYIKDSLPSQIIETEVSQGKDIVISKGEKQDSIYLKSSHIEQNLESIEITSTEQNYDSSEVKSTGQIIEEKVSSNILSDTSYMLTIEEKSKISDDKNIPTTSSTYTESVSETGDSVSSITAKFKIPLSKEEIKSEDVQSKNIIELIKHSDETLESAEGLRIKHSQEKQQNLEENEIVNKEKQLIQTEKDIALTLDNKHSTEIKTNVLELQEASDQLKLTCREKTPEDLNEKLITSKENEDKPPELPRKRPNIQRRSFSESQEQDSEIPPTLPRKMSKQRLSITEDNKIATSSAESQEELSLSKAPIVPRRRSSSSITSENVEMSSSETTSTCLPRRRRSQLDDVQLCDKKEEGNDSESTTIPRRVSYDDERTILSRKSKLRVSIEERMSTLQAEGKCLSREKAFIAAKLIEMQFEEEDALIASKQCTTVYHAVKFLTQLCELCKCRFPVNLMASMSHCPHKACKECLRAHFTTLIYDRSVFSLLCPVCQKPDISDNNIQDYFNHLDMMLRRILRPDVYDLFQRKLRDEVLTKDPNFHWCSQCSNGFIASPRLKKLYCPECTAITCASCHQTWEPEHEGVYCERFQQWKDMHTPEPPPAGLVKKLADRGVSCPSCGIKYPHACGGCMLYKCAHCNHKFCGFCQKPYVNGVDCKEMAACSDLGLHAHHPNNCLSFLRDIVFQDFQKLLTEANIPYATIPAPDQIVKTRCQVREQKHLHGAVTEDRCLRDIVPYFAGLCRVHYMEYLAEMLRHHKIDPLPITTTMDLQFMLRKARVIIPEKVKGETVEEYRAQLLQMVMEKLPL